MPGVRVRESEHFDAALRRFKRACEKAGVLTELRRREFYEKPTQERKRKKAAAVKRHLKRNSHSSSLGSRLTPWAGAATRNRRDLAVTAAARRFARAPALPGSRATSSRCCVPT